MKFYCTNNAGKEKIITEGKIYEGRIYKKGWVAIDVADDGFPVCLFETRFEIVEN